MLSAHGVQFEHHDIVDDEAAAAFLSERNIKTVPVVSVDDEVIVGFDQRRLTEALGLDIAPSADGTEWLGKKYEAVFDALAAAVQQIGQGRIEVLFARRRMTVRAHVLHIVSFAEGGWLTHRHGHFTIDDMFAMTATCDAITSVDAIIDYIERVRDDIAAYLRTADATSLGKIVSSHYGGQVSVLEVMRIMLRHSAHHLRQLDWFMQSELGIDMDGQLTSAVTGVTVPAGVFD